MKGVKHGEGGCREWCEGCVGECVVYGVHKHIKREGGAL